MQRSLYVRVWPYGTAECWVTQRISDFSLRCASPVLLEFIATVRRGSLDSSAQTAPLARDDNRCELVLTGRGTNRGAGYPTLRGEGVRCPVIKNGRCCLAGFQAAILLSATMGMARAAARTTDPAAVFRQIDDAVFFRVHHIAQYTVLEHYAVFRGKDETHPVAEMTVKTTYRPESGKSYQVVSTGGSAIVRHLGLDPLLEREKEINQPSEVSHSWITSANYDMTLKPGTQMLDGRECLVLAIHPKRKAPNLIEGSLWVDAKDGTIVRLEGVASKAPSVFAGVTHMVRQYALIYGFAMATHARAESNTFLYGRTVATIDYTDYQIAVKPGM